ncbi:MAG TPA: hypothetical protein PK264_13010 [Hyphomicrobiaceae bacterium]|nr:hypothetical protein [Hyphomicrobiaceae bacterium]
MAVDWDALDYDDPCALLTKLRPAYYRLLAGDAEEEIEGTDRRRVRFQRSDLKGLAAVIADLEAKCAAKSGKRRRFAMSGQARPRKDTYS